MEKLKRFRIEKEYLDKELESATKLLHKLQQEKLISLGDPLKLTGLEKQISDCKKFIDDKTNKISEIESEIEKEIQKNLARQTREKGRNPTHSTPNTKTQLHSPGNPNIRPNPKTRNVSNQNQYGTIIGISLLVCLFHFVYLCGK